MRIAAALLLLAAPGALGAESAPSVLSDLPDAVVAHASAGGAGDAAALLERVFAASTGYVFERGAVTVRTDRRWFEGATVEGPGAPLLELRRWPGDTVVAFYALPADGEPALPGLSLAAERAVDGGWTARDGTLATPRGPRPIVWCERRQAGRRVGALGVPGDAGLGAAAARGLREEILAVVRRTVVAPGESTVGGEPLVPPDVGPAPVPADEAKDGWQVFEGPGFTLGLPPGVRAIRLDLGVDPPRPVPGASVWLRGRFTDRDGAQVAIGDGSRAGYVAVIEDPDEAWLRGSSPPRGAPSAKRIDALPLGDLALSWTGATRAAAEHWREAGFSGDWLVFRLERPGEGIEIGLPVLASWRSLALLWIPVTWRPADRPPAPPPIDPAASRGIRFHRFTRDDAGHSPLLEGELFVADVRLDVPRGVWPVANLRSADGLPVTFVDRDGRTLGRLAAYPAGSPELAPRAEEGWVEQKHARSRGAAHVWTRHDGRAIVVAPDGHGYVFEPETAIASPGGAWERLHESASLRKRPAR